MPFMGELNVGDKVRIEFAAHHANSGTTLLSTGYVPLPAPPPAPVVPPVVPIAPAGVGFQTTTVGPALTLVIDVDVPPAGGGQLEVQVNGVVRDAGSIGSDQDWSYLVL